MALTGAAIAAAVHAVARVDPTAVCNHLSSSVKIEMQVSARTKVGVCSSLPIGPLRIHDLLPVLTFQHVHGEPIVVLVLDEELSLTWVSPGERRQVLHELLDIEIVDGGGPDVSLGELGAAPELAGGLIGERLEAGAVCVAVLLGEPLVHLFQGDAVATWLIADRQHQRAD